MIYTVACVDRPFTDSEVRFLKYIRQWGKKVIFLVNKVDILSDSAEVRRSLSISGHFHHALRLTSVLMQALIHQGRLHLAELGKPWAWIQSMKCSQGPQNFIMHAAEGCSTKLMQLFWK